MKLSFLATARLCLAACRYAKDQPQRTALVACARCWMNKAAGVEA